MIELRARNKVAKKALDERVGKILTDRDCDLVMEGPSRILKPDGKPLCTYLPGVLKSQIDQTYDILTTIRGKTTNRGLASGTPRTKMSETRSYSMPVASSLAGAFEASGNYKYCRLTSWTAKHLETEWPTLFTLFHAMGEQFRNNVPDRYKAQMEEVRRTPPEWVIPGTPFTTITINNSYSTGVHQDKGDLDKGFSCLAVARRGNYTGGRLIFPEYRVGADMRDGDLMLMDAHEWHGNSKMVCPCGTTLNKGPCNDCGSERISVVAYFRTNIVKCGSYDEELQRRLELENKAWEKTAAAA